MTGMMMMMMMMMVVVMMVGASERAGRMTKLAVKTVSFHHFTSSPVALFSVLGWLGSRVVSVLVSGAEWPGFKSQSDAVEYQS